MWPFLRVIRAALPQMIERRAGKVVGRAHDLGVAVRQLRAARRSTSECAADDDVAAAVDRAMAAVTSPPNGPDRPPIIVVGERRARGEDV